MRRRNFIKGFAGIAAVWPLAAYAQQSQGTRRIGVLMVIAETDSYANRYVEALESKLDAMGWHKGRNLEITYRWGSSDPERLARYGDELVRAAPDLLVAFGTPALVPLHKDTTTIPTVFTSVSDPVAQGFVESLAHPGGNETGFSNYELNIGGKWLQLLKEIAPSVMQVGVMFNPRTSPYNALWMHSIQTAAPSLGISAAQSLIESDEEIRSAISLLADKPGSGLIVPADSYTYQRAALITSLAASNRLPAIYSFPWFAQQGDLIVSTSSSSSAGLLITSIAF
jgi:putative ABC transport system substrate-binding protein